MRTALFWVITQWVVTKNYHYPLNNNPEEPSSQLLCSGSLKSCIIYNYYHIWFKLHNLWNSKCCKI